MEGDGEDYQYGWDSARILQAIKTSSEWARELRSSFRGNSSICRGRSLQNCAERWGDFISPKKRQFSKPSTVVRPMRAFPQHSLSLWFGNYQRLCKNTEARRHLNHFGGLFKRSSGRLGLRSQPDVLSVRRAGEGDRT